MVGRSNFAANRCAPSAARAHGAATRWKSMRLFLAVASRSRSRTLMPGTATRWLSALRLFSLMRCASWPGAFAGSRCRNRGRLSPDADAAGMLFHTLRDSGSAYVEQMSWKITQLDVHAFRQAWAALIAGTPSCAVPSSCRTGSICKPCTARRDPGGTSSTCANFLRGKVARIEDILRADRAREFELDHAPLLRFSLLRTAEDEHIFFFSHHHALFDGWSATAAG